MLYLKVALCIPTINAAATMEPLLAALKCQTRQPDAFLVIDSGSTDNSPAGFHAAGARLHVIPPNEFNHGGTRQLGIRMVSEAEIIVFLTQDAILADSQAFENLLACFKDERVGAAYGRQLPRPQANPIEAHARLFNYPPQSQVKEMADAPRFGIKTAFLSNSFAAYRREAFEAVGGFPSDVILSEDRYVAGKMLQAGWKVAYSAEATCYHSHNYSMMEEFRRYFDLGVFQGRESWYLALFGKAEGEGKKFVFSEIHYLLHHAPWLIPTAIVRTGMKLLGYNLGQSEHGIPLWLKRELSMNKGYWKNE